MSITELIIKDKVCINYAKSLAGDDYKDLLSDAIEKILSLENKGKVFNNKYKSYFYLTLKSVLNDKYRKKKVKEVELKQQHLEMKEETNSISIHQKVLENFLSTKFKDEKEQLAQVITELSLRMDKKEIAERTGYSKELVYQYLNIAKELIKDEYNRVIFNKR